MSSNVQTMVTPPPSATPTSTTAMQTYEGQLNKFTNVVKGWQYRWFVLTPETGNLDYYLMDEGVIGKRRGRQHIAGTVVIPSEEDSQTFHVNFASSESYKLRAANVRDRQVWVDRIRAVAHRHESAMARDNAPPIVHKELLLPPPGSKSLLASNGEPTPQLQHLSLSVLDAFGSVHDILQQTDMKHAQLARNIETLPMASSNLKCHDEDLLMLKATSQAALNSMESALNILQDLRDMNQLTATRRYKSKSSPLSLSPKHSSKSLFADREEHSPNVSACGSPVKEFHHDTLSVKSAAVLESGTSKTAMDSSSGLSASTSNIDSAGVAAGAANKAS
eukprot:08548.XXX_30076_31139_1 [CDS] Oithona nana genome sequencing.